MRKIKRWTILVLAVALCLSIAACGGSDGPSETQTPAPTEAPSPTKAPEPTPTPQPTPEPTPEPTPDISAFTGLWKYDDTPMYVQINEDFTWNAVDVYGKELAAGQVEPEDDCLALYQGAVKVETFRRIIGGLSDPDGATLTASDEMLLLPTPADPLDRTANFSGDFAAVKIDYPHQMDAHPHPNVSNSLSFNAVLEDGTDDYYSNILICFVPITGYDSYMTQGAATAQPYLKHMTDGILSSMYGNKILKSIGTDFNDCGSYYSMIDYLWMDSSVFSGNLTQPVRGCVEVRYYGPTGYALVAMSLAMEGRIRNYFEICNRMMETCNYDGGWSTAPKTVPARPTQGSDSGDYGTPYYWYDEDGDVWYWNGYQDVFIGFGDDYYIDDDGQYYESNDDGWDWDDYDYEEDYDPWSDPGDGWDDW